MNNKTSDEELKQQKIDYLVTFSSKEGERVFIDDGFWIVGGGRHP